MLSPWQVFYILLVLIWGIQSFLPKLWIEQPLMVILGSLTLGATNHIVHFVHILTDFTAINCVVELPNGETALVTHIGSTSICLSETLILTNVLCVPSFSFDLLSISQLTKKVHCCLIFLSTTCFIQDLNC